MIHNRPIYHCQCCGAVITQADVLFYKPLDVEPFLETLFRLMSC